MMLFKDEHGHLQHMPYRKKLSHTERIPWISAHPVDVKRGVFFGEISRMATLCSTFPAYSKATKEVVALFVSRGYPRQICDKWLKQCMAKRWERRLSEAEAPSDGGV